jgi:sugar lactone lactonase YvrE
VTTYADPALSISGPTDITAGPDGALWFTNNIGNSIGRITTAGAVTSYQDPGILFPTGITSGPDGALWFTNTVANSVGRITTAGAVTSFTDPNISNSLFDITSGPDGALWFGSGNSAIDRITTAGAVTSYTDPSISGPGGMTAGPDGALWFTNDFSNSIGRITTTGAVTNYPDPGASAPATIASGPDGALWFTNQTNNSIGKLTLGASGSVPGAPSITKVTAGDRQIAVSFTPGADGSSPTSGYVASCNPTGGGPGRSQSGGDSAIAVTGLTNGTDYTCTVIAFNDVGNSPRSKPSAVVTPADVTAQCTDKTTCTAAIPSSPSPSTPGQDVHVSGTPSAAVGSISLSTAPGTLGCPSVGLPRAPVTTLTDTGFSPKTRLSVTATLQITAATSTERVCFNSEVPFRSQASPVVKRAGTGMLLGCAQVANVAPCVTSSSQVGADIVVKFVVPGGDPRFYITLPKGRQTWLDGAGRATVGRKYAAHIEAIGGRAPFHWKVASGTLPAGLKLNTATGLISGTPTVRGKTSVAVQATDSEKPPRTAKLSVPITVK